MKNDKRELMREIRDEVINLKTSPLYAERVANNMFPVIGEGDHDAKVVFIGEAPGKNEAKTGRPFCGMSGRVLDELLSSVNIRRGDVYITNIVKDRPPLNRDPSPEEIDVYAPFLDRQIDIIQPKVLATLGRFSMGYILKKFGLEAEIKPIGELHGKIFEGKANFGKIMILPLYHPAVAIYNRNTKAILMKDFEVLKSVH